VGSNFAQSKTREHGRVRVDGPVNSRAYVRHTSRAKRARCREHSCPNARNSGQAWCGRHMEIWQRHHHVKVFKRWS